MQFFDLPNRALFFKSPRPHDARLGEEVAQGVSYSSIAKVKPGFVLLGHADDEGIRFNHGRSGAHEGPDAIRAMLYKLTTGREKFPALYDLGNFLQYGQLQERQQQELACIEKIFSHKHRLMSLGGGHDHVYADVGGLLKSIKKQKALVINIDAHLDMRTLVDSPNSGTGFYQLLEEFDNFDLVQIGIHPESNTTYYLDSAKKHKVKVFTWQDSHGQLGQVFKAICKNPSYKKRPVFLSVDMDAFSSAFAPGVSAPSPIGLDPNEFLKCLPYLMGQLNVVGLGIYEVAPKYDQDNQTSKLAAYIVHSYLYNS